MKPIIPTLLFMGIGLSMLPLGMYLYSIGHKDLMTQVMLGMIFLTSSIFFLKYVLKLNDDEQKVKNVE